MGWDTSGIWGLTVPPLGGGGVLPCTEENLRRLSTFLLFIRGETEAWRTSAP